MLVEIEVYRYYSDCSGFDFIFSVEIGDFKRAGELIDEAIRVWFEGNGDVYYECIGDFVQSYLCEYGIIIEIYTCINNDDDNE